MKTRKMYSGDINLFDENMNSCAIRLRYGKFSYYNGGDLSGGNLDMPSYPSKERDFHSWIAWTFSISESLSTRIGSAK